MTKQKTFKSQVRARMEKTSESYTAARLQLRAKAPAEQAPQPDPQPQPVEIGVRSTRTSDDAVARNTGKQWSEWFALLDDWGAAGRKHTEIARWLSEEHGLDGWWAQNVTVAYEQETGRRAPGQRCDGMYSVSSSKTVNVPVDRLFEAFDDPGLREQWLPGAKLEVTTSVPGKSFRGRWGDAGTGRLAAGFTAKGPDRAMAAVAIEKIDTPEEAKELKAYWADRMKVLKALLES